MQIPTKILDVWKIEIESNGVCISASEAKVNYRTLKNALETGICRVETFKKVNKYLLKKRKELNKAIETICEDQN
jgi:hypothetical protein